MSTNPSFEKQLLSHPVVWIMIVAFLALPFVMRRYMRKIPPAPPILGQLPPFQLVDHHGKTFGLPQLKGHVSVVGFFFSRCRTICPPLMQSMRHLQDKFQQYKLPIRMVSITVDPEYDTPAVLRTYAKTLGADLQRWSFVTGPIARIRELALKGFYVAVGTPQKEANFLEITHTSKLILVDQQGRVRGRPDPAGRPAGYFDTTREGLNELFHRSQHTLWEAFSR